MVNRILGLDFHTANAYLGADENTELFTAQSEFNNMLLIRGNLEVTELQKDVKNGNFISLCKIEQRYFAFVYCNTDYYRSLIPEKVIAYYIGCEFALSAFHYDQLLRILNVATFDQLWEYMECKYIHTYHDLMWDIDDLNATNVLPAMGHFE